MRDGFRSLVSQPTVTLAALLSLALGIGVNATLFSVYESLALRRLEVHEPQNLVVIANDDGKNAPWQTWQWSSSPLWDAFSELEVFDEMLAWGGGDLDLAQGGAKDLARALKVSSNFFEMLGLDATVGNLGLGSFGRDDSGAAVTILSHRFWMDRFGGSADVVGRTLSLERIPFTIVGVAPESFAGLEVGRRSFDVAIPITAEPLLDPDRGRLDNRFRSFLRVMGRLRQRDTLGSAQVKLRSQQADLKERALPPYPRPETREAYLADPFVLVPAGNGISFLRWRYEQPLLVMMILVGFILMIACANVASLLVARIVSRHRELGIRSALGASRARIVRLILVEGLLVAGVAGLLGLILSLWTSQILVRLLSTATYTVFLDVELNPSVVSFVLLIAVLTILIVSVGPALAGSRLNLTAVIGSGKSSTQHRGAFRLEGGIVVGQVALAVCLLVAAGLLSLTLNQFANRAIGVNPESSWLLTIDAGDAEHLDKSALHERVATALRELPATAAAGASVAVPLGDRALMSAVNVPGLDLSSRERRVFKNLVTPGWFDAFGTRILSGRDFTAQDREEAPLVAVVNEAFVRRFHRSDTSIVGQYFEEEWVPGEKYSLQIVGVVEDAVFRSIREESPPTLYRPVAQNPGQSSFFGSTLFAVVRQVPGAPESLASNLVGSVTNIDPALSVTLESYSERVEATYHQEWMSALLAGTFAGLALFLTAVGVYGLGSHLVGRRLEEIGIRMALGATRSDIRRFVVSRLMLLVMGGAALGTVTAYLLSPSLRSILYELSPREPSVFATAVLAVLVASLASLARPTLRASAVDPAAVIRNE